MFLPRPTLVLLSCAWICSGATFAVPQSASESQIFSGIKRTDSFRQANLAEYTVVRQYTLLNKRSGKSNTLTARMTYRAGVGKKFEILNINADGMAKRVLQRIVDNEAEASHKATPGQNHVTPENYAIKIMGTANLHGRPCYLIELTPLKKSRFLLQGKAWVDASEMAVVRMEGRPNENISFWVGKPYVVQEFNKVGEFWLASHNTSTSDSAMLGTNELTIEYRDYKLTGTTLSAQLGGSGMIQGAN